MLTVEDVRAWAGRVAQDPYGAPLGTIVGALHDEQTGSPEWLVIAPDGSETEGVLVPAGGALPTGRRIRVVPTADVVRAGPRVHVGDNIDLDAKRRAAAHYGLALDGDASGSGQLRDPDAPMQHAMAAEPPDAERAGADPRQRAAIVRALQGAQALEQASLRLLAAMRWRMRDEELVHDVALHHRETRGHAERVRSRLAELEAGRGRPLEWAARAAAYVQAQLGRARRHPDPADLKQAHAFEQGEAAAYERLERLAREAGDERTAALARAIRADELAMVMTIERSRLWRSDVARMRPRAVAEARSTDSGRPLAEAPRT